MLGVGRGSFTSSVRSCVGSSLPWLCSLPVQASPPIRTIRDGGTIDVGGVTYRLGGVDAPAADQLCIDDHADSWACGAEARDQLTKLIGDRDVHCDDQGPDAIYKKWHVGICTVQGEAASLNQLLVRSGFALNAASTGTEPVWRRRD